MISLFWLSLKEPFFCIDLPNLNSFCSMLQFLFLFLECRSGCQRWVTAYFLWFTLCRWTSVPTRIVSPYEYICFWTTSISGYQLCRLLSVSYVVTCSASPRVSFVRSDWLAYLQLFHCQTTDIHGVPSNTIRIWNAHNSWLEYLRHVVVSLWLVQVWGNTNCVTVPDSVQDIYAELYLAKCRECEWSRLVLSIRRRCRVWKAESS